MNSENVRRLRPLLQGLLAEEATDRWSLERTLDFLAASPSARAPAGEPRREPDVDALLQGGIDYLLDAMTPEDPARLWPATPYGTRSDACNVQHGAAGVVSVLTTLAHDRDDDRLAGAVGTGVKWIERRLSDDEQTLPGLYFGRAGTAWALYEASALLGDPGLAERAIALLDRLPVDWPNPDVTHGIAGAGLAMLRLWQATGADELRSRAHDYAGLLAERASRVEGLTLWPVPESFDSRLAGLTDYGFAHGAAGIGTFLLAAGVLLGEARWVELAEEVGRMLHRVARHDDQGTRWSSGPHDSTHLREFWCSGSSGIGTFLVRLAGAGSPEHLALAERAATAVWTRRWPAGPSVCHGLAGNGEFLLDLADATHDPRDRSRAEDLGTAIAARAAMRDGRPLAPDDTMLGFGAEYGTGVAGWVGFLHRLRHGGPRRWMVPA